MNNFKARAWCRYCRIWVKHQFLGNKVVCFNCGRETPRNAFNRYQERRNRFEEKNNK